MADYFVVAGLPKENPQLLDEYSLEVNLKHGAYQDPITDITVIFPSLAENVPDHFQLIDETPTGLSANLNLGSFRAPEVFVCYRRGRDRAPLLDIGVLYDGKERVAPDSQIVEFTAYNHSANVNNTHQSATYLTYRRATEVSPPNEMVVMDICVIVASKGETPPHSFKRIDKTLNKGMVGCDVYLCYKKSMNRPDLISYKPGVLCRFPLKNYPVYSLEETVALFCLPMGATLECWPSESTRPPAMQSTFVLTLASREKVYGTAITFYEEYDETLLTADQVELLNLKKTCSKGRKILANKCVCLLSRWPFFEAFKSFLFYLHKIQLMGPHDVPLERLISHFLYDVPFPSPERPRILVQLSAEEKIALFQPEELPLPRSGASFRNMLCNLGPDNCLLVLLLALTEQKILIHSFRPDVLTSVAEAVMQIIFPFYWQCPYIPLCPIGMSDYLAAPLPFVMGLDSRFFDLYDQPPDVNAVDLDTATVTLGQERKGLCTKLLPKRACRQLRSRLVELTDKHFRHLKLARELEAHNDGAIDFEFKMKRKEMMLEMEIREAFLHFMVSVLAGYKSFLLPIVSAPTVGATDVANLFNQTGFLNSRDRTYHRFYHLLMRTQMFTKFIEERSFVSEANASLAFFDDCVDRSSVENNHHSADEPCHFLELESVDSDRTVFILPPDATGLPKGAEYIYEKFENLNQDLFEERPLPAVEEVEETAIIQQQHCNNSDFATPISLARRTKQEIRSAQKSARKNVEVPYQWAKCLVNTTYSLWFIHLPGHVVFKQKDHQRPLKAGLQLLKRMQRLRLHPADEICYRVMMQLCGVYQRPELAMDVMDQMNRVCMTPNAVTYGHYNKAVLESKWVHETEATRAQRLWNTLSIVLDASCRFRLFGKEARTPASFARKAKEKVESRKSESRTELDNVSRSSQESGLSRISSTEVKQQQVTTTTTTVSSSEKQTDQPDSGRVSASEGDKDKEELLETEDGQFRQRLHSIVRPPCVGDCSKESPCHEHKEEEQPEKPETSPSKQRTFHNRPINFAHQAHDQGVTRVKDLKLESLGQDKQILDTLQQQQQQKTSLPNKNKSVNRVLFNDNDNESREVSEARSDEFDFEVPAIKSRSQSVESSDDGMTMSLEPAALLDSQMSRPSTLATLPTVHENDKLDNNFLTPPHNNVSPNMMMHKVASSGSIKLMGVPVTGNDPLGALSSSNLTTNNSLTKSATAGDLQQRSSSGAAPDESILGAPPFSSMARSATMPMNEEGLDVDQKSGSYFSLTSIKSMTKTGQSRLNNLKKGSGGYIAAAASNLMSPTSKVSTTQDALHKGFSSLKSVYASATTTLSKRVEELRTDYQTPSKASMDKQDNLSPASSSQNLLLATPTKDDDALSQCSTTDGGLSRRPSDNHYEQSPESWSQLTGQLWEQLWRTHYGYDQKPNNMLMQQQQQQQLGGKAVTDLFEDLYSYLPKRPPAPVALELYMTSCSRCRYCSAILYDEEIMSGWTAEDSNLNTRCAFCQRMVVPFLTVHVIDFRTRPYKEMAQLLVPSTHQNGFPPEVTVEEESTTTTIEDDDKLAVTRPRVRSTSECNTSSSPNSPKMNNVNNNNQKKRKMSQPICSEPITVPYLSPLVLRKELENMLETEGDACLGDADCVDQHPIIYWNLVWYFERVAVKSHLPGMLLKAKSVNSSPSRKRLLNHDDSWTEADFRNVFIRCRWDNERLYEESGGLPLYVTWRNSRTTTPPAADAAATAVKVKDDQDDQDDNKEDNNKKSIESQVIAGVQHNDLIQPIKTLLDDRKKVRRASEGGVNNYSSTTEGGPSQPQPQHRSIYREVLFLTLVALGQDNIDLSAFDREYRRAFDKLPAKYQSMAQASDRPPSNSTCLCRKLFRELRL